MCFLGHKPSCMGPTGTDWIFESSSKNERSAVAFAPSPAHTPDSDASRLRDSVDHKGGVTIHHGGVSHHHGGSYNHEGGCHDRAGQGIGAVHVCDASGVHGRV